MEVLSGVIKNCLLTNLSPPTGGTCAIKADSTASGTGTLLVQNNIIRAGVGGVRCWAQGATTLATFKLYNNTSVCPAGVTRVYDIYHAAPGRGDR